MCTPHIIKLQWEKGGENVHRIFIFLPLSRMQWRFIVSICFSVFIQYTWNVLGLILYMGLGALFFSMCARFVGDFILPSSQLTIAIARGREKLIVGKGTFNVDLGHRERNNRYDDAAVQKFNWKINCYIQLLWQKPCKIIKWNYYIGNRWYRMRERNWCGVWYL